MAAKFSIITVVLNDLEGLQRTHRSIVAQTSDDYEWLVIDGASTDGTVQWLEGLADHRARWWSAPDEGIYDAMNRGIEKAGGEYLVFLNAGDELASESVLETVAALSSGTRPPDLIFGDAIDVAQDGQTWRYRSARSHESRWWTMFACHQAMYFRRERIGPLRYRLQYRHSADHCFVSEFLDDRHPGGAPVVEKTDQALCRFWLGGDSWAHRPKAMREAFQVRAKHLGMGTALNVLLFLAHHVYFGIRKYLPPVARLWRYRRGR